MLPVNPFLASSFTGLVPALWLFWGCLNLIGICAIYLARTRAARGFSCAFVVIAVSIFVLLAHYTFTSARTYNSYYISCVVSAIMLPILWGIGAWRTSRKRQAVTLDKAR